jgi:hypothetical protein
VTTCTNNQIAQKRQSEKLLEQIRKLEEIEKTLSQQMVVYIFIIVIFLYFSKLASKKMPLFHPLFSKVSKN